MSEEELPYRAEYAKSGRASCKTCKEKIDKETLRIAAMVQSPMFDGKVPNWYHYKCFFVKQRPTTVADIAHFDSLRYDDQEKLKQKVESALASGAPPPTKGRGKGKGKAAAAGGGGGDYKEFSVEVTKAGRAGCRGCEQKILKNEIRISKMDYTSDSARQYGPMPRWHHTECFLEVREELQYYGAATDLPGFYAMPADRQDEIKGKIKPMKRKAEDVVDSAPAVKKPKKEDEQILKKQNDVLFKYRDQLKNNLSKVELVELIEHNYFNFESTGLGESILLDRVCDYMAFGMPACCSLCKSGVFAFVSGKGYACTGHLTEYTRCNNVERAPKKKTFTIPSELAEMYPFLRSYKQPGLGDRLFVDRGPTSAAVAAARNGAESKKTQGPKRPGKPLAGLSIHIHNVSFSGGRKAKELSDVVKGLGGSVAKKVTDTTAAVITTADGLAKGDKTIEAAQEYGVQCLAEEFLDEIKDKGSEEVLTVIKKSAISDWGKDPEKRVSGSKLYSKVHKSGKSSSSSSSKGGSRYTKSMPDTLKLKLKDGGAVDPDSGLSEAAHVLTSSGKLYNCVLGMVDIVKGTNSYYKLQVLESDTKDSWWVFRSWGRIGTTIGGNKLMSMEDKQDAISNFKEIYEDKTGNRFSSETFSKVAGRWTLLDIDYGGDNEDMQKLVVSESKSSLPLSVQQLVALLFDVDTMKSQMMEFEIDLKKLPLGKLSSKQIKAAYSVLAEAQDLLIKDDKNVQHMILDCSNRFYTLIPHDFGMNKVPLLDNLDLIKTKIEMVESLSEIEVAYSLMKSDSGDAADDSAIDSHYKKLNTKIEEVDTESEEYDMLQKYVTNTHASTHSNYTLKIENVFRVERKGEAKRFKPFQKLPNHKLLWHGSRLTNFVGILSQGLRIAPPEAPATGYMFGKGIYFADMVSKSANYCSTSSNKPTGLMLLCDVALGNMYELQRSEYVTKLASGKHSTKGCGRTHPDPASAVTLHGVEVPLGKPVDDATVSKSSLLYNEYIVYDIGQVQVKYMLKLDFKYNL